MATKGGEATENKPPSNPDKNQGQANNFIHFWANDELFFIHPS